MDSHSGGVELCFLPVAGFYPESDEVVAELAAPRDGMLMAERNLCRIREGDLAILVAEVEDLGP